MHVSCIWTCVWLYMRMSMYVIVYVHMLMCWMCIQVCDCVGTCVHVYGHEFMCVVVCMFVYTHVSCLWFWVCISHGICVEVQGQPWVLVPPAPGLSLFAPRLAGLQASRISLFLLPSHPRRNARFIDAYLNHLLFTTKEGEFLLSPTPQRWERGSPTTLKFTLIVN